MHIFDKLLNEFVQVPCVTRRELAQREKNPVLNEFYENAMAKIAEEKSQGKWQKRPIPTYTPEPEPERSAFARFMCQPVNGRPLLGLISLVGVGFGAMFLALIID